MEVRVDSEQYERLACADVAFEFSPCSCIDSVLVAAGRDAVLRRWHRLLPKFCESRGEVRTVIAASTCVLIMTSSLSLRCGFLSFFVEREWTSWSPSHDAVRARRVRPVFIHAGDGGDRCTLRRRRLLSFKGTISKSDTQGTSAVPRFPQRRFSITATSTSAVRIMSLFSFFVEGNFW